MKKRKTLLTVALLAAVLVLGVGYAAVTGGILEILGTARAAGNADAYKVAFDSSVDPVYSFSADHVNATAEFDVDSNVLINEAVVGTTTIRLNADGFQKKGDKATVTLSIKNFSKDYKSKLSNIVIDPVSDSVSDDEFIDYTGSTGYFNVTAKFAGDAADVTLGAEESTTVVVTIELTKTPVNDKSIDFTISFDHEPLEI